MSDLMQTALKILRVNSHVSVAGFHARTAVAERYCRTVERYLKPYYDNYKGKWGLLLPWIAFQLRQAPCSVTHFSPHELVLGKNFPDQLEDLRDELMGLSDSSERELKRNVLSYVTELRQRLSVTREIAHKNADIEHQRTKLWYDKHCTPDKNFKPGDKVLVLEPVDSRKMSAKWSEPAEVIKQAGLRTYDVKLADETIKSFHINQLRMFNERTDFVCPVIVTADINKNKPILVAPKHDRDYIIMSDATDHTIAGILAQKADDGSERNVAYFSRKLLPNEVNYSVLEKEALGLGILACCLKWHDWIYGHKVIARTDHRALAFLESPAQHNSRIARWKVILSNYQLTTEYRRGADHGNCDGLSRVEFNE